MVLERLLDVERDLFLALNSAHTPFWDHFFWIFTGKWCWIALVLLIVYVLFRKKDWRESCLILLFLILLITLCDQFSSTICKPYFARFRPTHHPLFKDDVLVVFNYVGGRYGFISGHASNAFGVATFFALLIRHRAFTPVILLWAVLMSYTRIYLGVHFISDIIAGMVAGTFFGFFCFYLYRFARRKLLKRYDSPDHLFSFSDIRLLLLGICGTTLFIFLYSLFASW